MAIKAGMMVTPKEQIRGMLIIYNHGDELRVVVVYGQECTIEKTDGTGSIVGVLIGLLRPIKS